MRPVLMLLVAMVTVACGDDEDATDTTGATSGGGSGGPGSGGGGGSGAGGGSGGIETPCAPNEELVAAPTACDGDTVLPSGDLVAAATAGDVLSLGIVDAATVPCWSAAVCRPAD